MIVMHMRSTDLAKQQAEMNPLSTGEPLTTAVAVNTAVLRDLGNQTRDLLYGAQYGTNG